MTDTPSTGTADDAEFERIDWERLDDTGRRFSAERIALVVGLVALVGVYLYYRSRGNIYLAWRWNVGPVDWLLLLSLVVLGAYVAVPLVRSRRTVGRFFRRFRTRPAIPLAAAFLGGVLLVGGYGIVGFAAGELTNLTLDRFQPPVWDTVPYGRTRHDCVGHVPSVESWTADRSCHGTWKHPLGTDRWGYDMIDLLIAGARPIVYVTLITIGLILPLATVVGLVSGYYGGGLDDLLMSYVDAQLAVPAIVVYLIAFMFFGDSMFVLIVAFGLLSWGGIARIVRSEALQCREEGYVLVARSIGAPPNYIIRRHLLPNVTNTVVPATFHLLAVLVLTEAGLSFLGFNATFNSWGMTISEGLYYGPPMTVWWTSTFPAIALVSTVAAFKLLGDGLRDVLDPRWDP